MKQEQSWSCITGNCCLVLATVLFLVWEYLWRKLQANWSFSLGFIFCLGKVRQIQEAKAVESPRAETEPVVVFLILFCTYSHSLTTLQAFCTRSRLEGSKESQTYREKQFTPHTRMQNPSTTISFKTFTTRYSSTYARGFCLSRQNEQVNKIQSLSSNSA